VTHLLDQYGLVLLFLVVAAESFGVPLPGETSLIAAGVLAAEGHFSIVAVVVVAAAAAIVGDNGGYWLARKGGRRLLERLPLVGGQVQKALPRAERFFDRHGGKTVFIGRFVSLLRWTAAWLAGISHMAWWRFLAWNAAGGIVWAAAVGVVSYYGGRAAADAIGRYGAYGAGAIAAAVVLGALGLHLWRRHAMEGG
jgi:membrane protein DedA with SNARE-associated domain